VDTDFRRALEGKDEIQISFVKKSGAKRTLPIWFTFESGTLELLPMYGLKTLWFRGVEAAGSIEVRAGGATYSAAPVIVKDRTEVERVKGLFAKKYGISDVKRYYPTSDVALEIPV
jgi:hypothetical protein